MAAPSEEEHEGAEDEGDGVAALGAFSPGVTKRQTWNRMTGEARTSPPKTAILIRSERPSSGEVTKRLHVPFDATRSEVSRLPVWCTVDASTVQSGRSRKCRIGS